MQTVEQDKKESIRKLEELEKKYEKDVELGRAAARQATNPDWLAFAEYLQTHFGPLLLNKEKNYDALLATSETADDLLNAAIKAKVMGEGLRVVESLMNLPKALAEKGELSKAALTQIREDLLKLKE